MATYLLTWNPDKWNWADIEDDIAKIHRNGFLLDTWSSGTTKKIQPGDRVFLMRLGSKPRGIVASGWAASSYFEAPHWGNAYKTAIYIDVKFDTIINPAKEMVFPIEHLRTGIYQRVHWTPQASGMSIPDDVAEQLEIDWASFLNRTVPEYHQTYADEIDEGKKFHEGTVRQVRVNAYERNSEARIICINRYGASCSVCGFNFGEKFGQIGEGFIHVHHLKPLSDIRGGYILNPIDDLRPVCPNCHVMLHRRDPVYSIDELREMLKQGR